MRLLGVAALDADSRRERRRGLVGLGSVETGKAREQLVDRAVAGHRGQVADDERAAARAGPATLAKGDDVVAREGAQVLLGAQHRAAERVVAERGLVDQVLG